MRIAQAAAARTGREPFDCDSLLREVLSELEPTRQQIDAAARSQRYLREVLDSGRMAARIVDDFLSGSYARDTAVRPLDDVDIVFVIDPTKFKTSWWATHPSPEGVLQSFANAIRYRYSGSSVRIQRRSVRLKLNHLDIDVVPAIPVADDPTLIQVADTSDNTWILSGPKRHTKLATEVNHRRRGNFKPLVKLLKFWNSNLPTTARYKSFAVETIATRIFTSLPFGSLQEGLLLFFDFITSLDGASRAYDWRDRLGISLSNVPDTAGTGSNLVARVEPEARTKFVEHAARSRDRLLEAQQRKSVDGAWSLVSKAIRI